MTLRTRILLSFILVVGVGFYFLVDYIVEDLRPRYLEAVEESLVDHANVLAALLESDLQAGQIQTASLDRAFAGLKDRVLNARIYKMLKTGVDERVYVTDADGRVLFDSEGRDVGKDFSRWNDVHLTLQGGYGARTTRDEPKDPTTSVLHVGAPIKFQDRIIGVVTVRKPTQSINEFIQTARPKILIAGWVAALGVILLAVLLSLYFTRPIHQLTRYARAVRDGRRVQMPKLGRGEIAEMGQALEQMREALEGKKYVEQYVQTLTHELKSPLAAIQGAVEILTGDLPAEQRRHFLNNIGQESERMRALVERLLELAALESQGKLREVRTVDFSALLERELERNRTLLEQKHLKVQTEITPDLPILGDRFLLEHLFQNLLQNAIDFSPEGGLLRIKASALNQEACLELYDEGPGIPDYAQGKIFDRFYSLARPDTGKKSSGLGLSFVKEVAELHGGTISIENREGGGVLARFRLPLRER